MSTVVAIEIKPERIILAEGQNMKGKVLVTNVAVGDLPKSAVSESEIRDLVMVRESLQHLIKSKGIRSKKAIVTLDIGNMLIREFDVPAGKAAEVAGMVRTEMIQNYSASESDVIQFTQIGSEEGKVKVRATALSKQIVQGYYDLIKSLKLNPVAMDSNANGIEKLMQGCKEINGEAKSDKPFVILDFSGSGSVIHALNHGSVQISRYTALGLDDMNEYISSKVNSFGEKVDYLGSLDFNREEESEIKFHALNFMDQWCSEIQKVIKFILLRMDDHDLSHVYLTGDACSIPGIERVIGERVFSKTEILTSLSNVQFRKPSDQDFLFQSIHAVGAMIRL